MNRFRLFGVFSFLVLFAAGCTQAIQLQPLERIDVIPKQTYVSYTFSIGENERYRAVFLKSPESDREVVASTQIRTGSGTFEDALNFMRRGVGYREVDIHLVTYNGKTLGYLLTQSVPALGKPKVRTSIYERGGKIYFVADEILDVD